MAVVRVRHTVKDFTMWKRAFDADPLDRAGSNVRRYRIMRDATDELDLTIDLMFSEVAQAEEMARRLRELWRRPEVAGMLNEPTAAVLVEVEERALA
jgi:hypothetical protein